MVRFDQYNKFSVDAQPNPIISIINMESEDPAALAKLSIHWIFVLCSKLSDGEQRLINQFFYTPEGWEDNFGNGFDDFLGITQRITAHDRSACNLEIKLVVDPRNYKAIFQNEKNRAKVDCLDKIKTIYLVSPSNETEETKRLRQENQIIDKSVVDLSELLGSRQKEIESQKLNSKLLPNFNILGYDRSEKISDERRIKIYACCRLLPTQYPKYMGKFEIAMKKSLYLFASRIEQTISQVRAAILELQRNEIKPFYKRMLALYQKESSFYHVLNLYTKKCADNNFEWDSMALPISLMFKAIKFYFLDEDNREEIDGMFDQNGQCVLWRGAKYSPQELSELADSQKHSNIFYEQVSFTSTSTSKNVALGFILNNPNKANNTNISDFKDYCLFKYILRKPNFDKQIENLDFIYLSFAKMLKCNNEKQVLLNSLTVCRLNSINKLYFQISNKRYNYLLKGYENVIKKVEIPEIQMEIVGNLISPYFHQSRLDEVDFTHSNLRALPSSIKRYLTTADIIKTYKHFDISLALEYSGHFEQAYNYFFQALQSQLNNPRQNLREIYYLQSRLATLLQKMEKSQQAIQYINKAIETCDRIKQEQKNITMKEHHTLLFKMIQKSSFILQENDYYMQSIDQINRQLDGLRQKIKNADLVKATSKIYTNNKSGIHKKPNLKSVIKEQNMKNEEQRGQKYNKQLYRFQQAEYLLQRGTIEFKEGIIGEARRDIMESKEIINQILIDIEYEKLKSETFYFAFILHFILEDHIIWDFEDFSKQQRMKNIAQATSLFGGEDNITEIKNYSAQFEQEVTEFIRIHEENLDQNLNLPGETLVKKIESQFYPLNPNGKLKLSDELQNKIRDFFSYFQKIIAENQNETKKVIEEYEKEFHKILIEDIPKKQMISSIMTSEQKLEQCRDAIVHCVLTDLKSTYNKEQHRLQIEKKMDELIYLKRELNKNELEFNYEKLNADEYQDYCRRCIMGVNKTFNHYEKDNLHFSQVFRQKLNNRLTNFHQNMGNQKEELNIINNELAASQSERKNKFRALNIASNYLSKMAIHFSEAEIDFEHALVYRGTFQLEEIRQYQKSLIETCKQCLRQARVIVKDYWGRNRLQIQRQAEDHKIKKRLIKKDIEINLWDMKIKVFEMFFARESRTASKMVSTSQLLRLSTTVRHQIQCRLSPEEQYQYLAEYYEACSFFFYILKRFDTSYLNLKNVLRFLRISNSHKRIRVFTKLFFMFVFEKEDELQSEQRELTMLYKRYSAYPLYWRICLAYHFYFRMKRPSVYPLYSCLKQIKRINSYKFHHNLIELSELKMYRSYLSRRGELEQDQLEEQLSQEINPESTKELNSCCDKFYKQNEQFWKQYTEVELPFAEDHNKILALMKIQAKNTTQNCFTKSN